MKKKIVLTTFTGTLAVCLAGCGGTTGAVLGLNSNPRVRVADLFTSPTAVSEVIDQETIDTNASFGAVSSYTIFPNGNHNVQFLSEATQAPLESVSPLFALNEYATVVGYNTGPSSYANMVVSDMPAQVDQGVRIKVVNAAAVTGSVDVFVTLSGVSITNAPATASGVAVGDPSQPYTLEPSGPGTYEIRVTTPGTHTVLASYTMASPIAAGQSETFVLVDKTNGAPEVVPLSPITY